MAIVRDAAKNVLDFVRIRRVRENDQDTDGAVLSPTLAHMLEGHTQLIHSAAFLPDGEHLVSGSWDHTVRKWGVTDGRQVGKVMRHGCRVEAVAVSGNGKVIASGGEDGKVVLWNSETYEKLAQLQMEHVEDWINSLSFVPDSQTVASGSMYESIVVWSVLTGERVAGPVRGHLTYVKSVAFSPAGDKIAGAGGFNMSVFDSSLAKELIPPITIKADIWSLVWSTDGRQLICGDWNDTIHCFNSSNGAPLATCRGHTNGVTSLAVSQCGRFFASASLDYTVRLWSTSTHQQLAFLEHPDRLYAASISSNDRYLASAGFDPAVYIWRFPDFEQLQENKVESAATITDPSGPQPAPMNVNGDDADGTASVEHATPAQDPQDEDDPQGSHAAQRHHMTRTASRESWLNMPAILPAPANTVPVGDEMFSQFFGEDVPSAPQPDSDNVRPGKWKKKAKDSRQYLFKQLKNFRAGVLPRDSPSNTNNAARSSSSQKLKDRINRIRRRSSFIPENAEERDSDQQGKNEAKSTKLKPSFIAYNRLRQTLAIASNDPPVQQKKFYLTMSDGRVIRKPAPSVPDTSQQQSPSGQSTSPSTTSLQGQGSSSGTIPPASTPVSPTDINVEGCGCCGFFISVRRL